ncbi:MAG TPA: hypothetical protein VM261_27620 [Kofleriaceae bacterium]|nr:hypothetical protein [Kofleriaceae bacterium]
MNIGDLPFHRRPALELLGLTHELGDRTIDVDYTGFGWTRVERLWLDDGSSRFHVADALVLALHSADDGEHLGDDVELEFVLDATATGGSVTVLASAFLERWLPRLPAASAIVLAMCNPRRARLRALNVPGTAPLFHGMGDVDSWLDDSVEGPTLRLTAQAWCTVVPGRTS